MFKIDKLTTLISIFNFPFAIIQKKNETNGTRRNFYLFSKKKGFSF